MLWFLGEFNLLMFTNVIDYNFTFQYWPDFKFEQQNRIMKLLIWLIILKKYKHYIETLWKATWLYFWNCQLHTRELNFIPPPHTHTLWRKGSQKWPQVAWGCYPHLKPCIFTTYCLSGCIGHYFCVPRPLQLQIKNWWPIWKEWV